MEEMKMAVEAAKEKVAQLLDAEIEQEPGLVIVKKKRMLEIVADSQRFFCVLDHDISFEENFKDGAARNKAEVFLLPEEYPAFFLALSEYPIPIPPDFRQWQNVNPHIISVCLESVEPPEHFAERLAAALNVLEQ